MDNINTSSVAFGPQRVLIVLMGAIGDVTRALPLAVRIKRQWPNVHLTWAVEPRSAGVIQGHQYIDEVIVFDRPGGFLSFLQFIKQLRRAKFDLVLDLQRHFKSGIATVSTKAKRRIGFGPKNAKEFNWLFSNEYIPAVENFSAKIQHYQLFGDKLRLDPLNPLEFGLTVSSDALKLMEERIARSLNEQGIFDLGPSSRVALILGSSWKSRLWFVEHYQKLIRDLFEKYGLISILVGGPEEREFGQRIVMGDLPAINLAGQTKLSDLFAVFSLVKFAVGPDSGPMHIAAAIGLPVISLWGSTSPRRSAPYGSEAYVLQSAIGCSPCYRRNCPGLENLCMYAIPPDAILAQTRLIMAKSAGIK